MARFLEKTRGHVLGPESKALRGFYCNHISRLWIPAIPYSVIPHTRTLMLQLASRSREGEARFNCINYTFGMSCS
ncbi:hypothetical protein SADUNF_Sadunf08G0106000 [Salix dunnii]|uniref:Uncharacterized protein n=1 Tax=Salix dunnii TaxID=1413687 RepID=A0A835MSN9_9ROSI|nr:hypothetical protein SADUNF_Sadunf08G0106000 [Salix dunnii]